jgi:hypothetical protein
VIPLLKKRAKQRDTSIRIYPPGWWSKNQFRAGQISATAYEFVSPATLALGTTFVMTLGDILDEILSRKKNTSGLKAEFRVTVHRLFRFGDEEYFQQISPYGGDHKESGPVTAGRIFPVRGGIVGLACRTRKTVIVEKGNRSSFETIWNRLQFPVLEARAIQPRVASLLACPFFSSAPKKGVSLVLFADSSKGNFFTKNVLRTIYAACKGFVNNIDAMIARSELVEIGTDYEGYVPSIEDKKEIDAEVRSLKRLGAKFDNEVFRSFKADLTFKKVRCFHLDALGPNTMGAIET